VSVRGLVVLGMHRSGTSAAARVVNLLGVPLLAADDLLPADEVNPRGYWESERLLRANDELLEAAGGSWSYPPARFEWEPAAVERARAELGSLFSGEWVWKDPRACVTLPFWREAFSGSWAVLLVLRDPREVAASLAARDGFSAERSFALWERSLRSALAAAEGLPALVTEYDSLLADPRGWAREVSAFLGGLGFSAGDPGDAVAAFVEPGLRRSRAVPDALSAEQRTLADAVAGLRGAHAALPAVAVGPETAGTEELLRREEIAGLRARAQSLEGTLDDVLGSRSYRWSAPARRVAGALVRLRRPR
jgi:hypothetical protein